MDLKGKGPQNRTERKKEETRLRIISVAMTLFKEQGVDATTMEQIAREVDIAKGTLYNYFPVKEAIIAEYIQQSFKINFAQRLRQLQKLPDTRSRMFFILSLLIEGIQAQSEIFEKFLLYLIQSMVSVHRNASAEIGLRMLSRQIVGMGQEEGELRKDVPIDILVALFEFVFVEVAQEYYIQREAFDAQQTIGYCIDLFMNGAQTEIKIP